MQFMNYAMRRSRLEFMPDVSDRSEYINLLLEGTQEDSKGLQFQLKNMGTPNFYESGQLTFRELLQ